MIKGIESVFQDLEGSRDDQESAILGWSAESIRKDSNVQNAVKVAKDAQKRFKEAGNFPILVPAELVESLKFATGHQNFVGFSGIGGDKFMKVVDCATQVFSGRTEAFEELRRALLVFRCRVALQFGARAPSSGQTDSTERSRVGSKPWNSYPLLTGSWVSGPQLWLTSFLTVKEGC